MKLQVGTTALLSILVALGAVLRFYQLDFQSLWVDEIAVMNGCDPAKSITQVLQFAAADQPPLFPLIAHAWFKWIGFTDLSGRILSAVIGLAVIPVMFHLGRIIRNERTGFLAAFLISINYIHIFFSQDTRFYTLLVLLSALSTLFFVKCIQQNKARDFVAFALVSSLLIYTHYYGFVLIAAEGLVWIVLVTRRSMGDGFIRNSVLSGFGILLLIAPWIKVFLANESKSTFWIQPEPFYFPIMYFYIWIRDYTACVIFGVVLLIWLWRLFIPGSKDPSAPIFYTLIGIVFFSFLIPAIYSFVRIPLLHPRYLLIVLPVVLVLISVAIESLSPLLQKGIVIVCFLSGITTLFVVKNFYTESYKEDWRGLASRVDQQRKSADIVVSPKAQYANYYFSRLSSPSIVRQVDTVRIETIKDGVWWIDAFDLRPEKSDFELRLLKSGFVEARRDSLFRARAVRYERK